MSKKLMCAVCLFVLCLALTGQGQGTGTIRYEVWEGIGGTSIPDLTNSPDFPENPSWDDEVTLFETPTDIMDNFGGRLYGWLHPDTSGDYTFWIAADDNAELWLSTTDSADDAVLIAYEDGWAPARSWADGNEMSAPIALEAGQAYYIEALYKEGGGGDNLAVGWTTVPDMNLVEVIDGAYLSPAPRQPSLLKAKNPVPADGAIELVQDDLNVLSWEPGADAVSFDVYISVDGAIEADDFVANVTDPNFAVPEAAVPGITYYWRVDCVAADASVAEGPVWTATTMSDAAHFPMPADGDLWRLGIDTELSWTPGVGALFHNVYFSTDQALVDARDASVATMFHLMSVFVPTDLELSTTYYWAVDESTGVDTVAGPTWSFTVFSFDPEPIKDPSLVLRATFDEIQGGLINDKSGYENFGTVIGDVQIADLAGDKVGQFAGTAEAPAYVDFGQPDSLTTGSDVTVTAWVKMNEGNDGAYMGIGGKLSTQESYYRGFSLVRHSSGVFRLWADDGNGVIGGFDASSDVTYTDTEWHHIAGVVDANVSTLYVDGVMQVKQGADIALTDSLEYAFIGKQYSAPSVHRYWNGLIDDFRIYDRAISATEVTWVASGLGDVTGPNDVVVGVPDEARDGSVAGWPDGEYPGLAVDDDATTKFLHFKGEVEATGIKVTPAAGATIVTGLTLTTANDAAERDPATYEVYGSNEGIDGPYELIASGDVVDFTAADAYPRFTKNVTAITFENSTAYTSYQVLFPTVRDAGAANSMQIAEIELIGEVAPVLVEDFDSLELGSGMHDVPGWEGWFGDAQYGAMVVDTVAYSGTQSLEIKGTRDDVVPNWPMVSSGLYIASVMQYVPTGTGGNMYYGPLSSYGSSWDDTAWLGTLLTNCDADTVYVNELDAGTRVEAPLVRDAWVECRIVMNFDADTCDFYYGDVLLGTMPCPSAMGFDIWPDDNVDVLYYDDFSFGAAK